MSPSSVPMYRNIGTTWLTLTSTCLCCFPRSLWLGAVQGELPRAAPLPQEPPWAPQRGVGDPWQIFWGCSAKTAEQGRAAAI